MSEAARLKQQKQAAQEPTLSEAQWQAIGAAAQARAAAEAAYRQADSVLALTLQAAGIAGDWHIDLDKRTIARREADTP